MKELLRDAAIDLANWKRDGREMWVLLPHWISRAKIAEKELDEMKKTKGVQ